MTLNYSTICPIKNWDLENCDQIEEGLILLFTFFGNLGNNNVDDHSFKTSGKLLCHVLTSYNIIIAK